MELLAEEELPLINKATPHHKAPHQALHRIWFNEIQMPPIDRNDRRIPIVTSDAVMFFLHPQEVFWNRAQNNESQSKSSFPVVCQKSSVFTQLYWSNVYSGHIDRLSFVSSAEFIEILRFLYLRVINDQFSHKLVPIMHAAHQLHIDTVLEQCDWLIRFELARKNTTIHAIIDFYFACAKYKRQLARQLCAATLARRWAEVEANQHEWFRLKKSAALSGEMHWTCMDEIMHEMSTILSLKANSYEIGKEIRQNCMPTENGCNEK